jgi:hypothetical protein
VEPIATHKDVTTLMAMIADIKVDVAAILRLLSEDDGEEEEEDETDLDR